VHCAADGGRGKLQGMKHGFGSRIWNFALAAALLMAAFDSLGLRAEPTAAATAAFASYIGGVEARLAQEHASAGGFLAPENIARLRQGNLTIEELTPTGGKDLGGALLHDWRGTAFAPGATAADFERVMKDFGSYPQRFSPQVLRAAILAQQGDHYRVAMRVRQKHILTVVMDTSYDVTFGRADLNGSGRGYNISRSTQVAEIDAPGTAHERTLGPD
jgi:hypothetical protein